MSKIILFDEFEYKSECIQITKETPEMTAEVNDAISSLIVIEGTWELFEHADYQGNCWVVQEDGGPDGDGCYPKLAEEFGTKNTISSLKPLNGY